MPPCRVIRYTPHLSCLCLVAASNLQRARKMRDTRLKGHYCPPLLSSSMSLSLSSPFSHLLVRECLVRLGDLHEHILRHLVVRVLRCSTIERNKENQGCQIRHAKILGKLAGCTARRACLMEPNHRPRSTLWWGQDTNTVCCPSQPCFHPQYLVVTAVHTVHTYIQAETTDKNRHFGSELCSIYKEKNAREKISKGRTRSGIN